MYYLTQILQIFYAIALVFEPCEFPRIITMIKFNINLE